MNKILLYGGLAVASVSAPLLFQDYQMQLAYLWLMVLLAITWDIQGGQMGYNSFGNVVFFGIGMYTTAVIQRAMFFDFGEYEKLAGMLEAIGATDYLISLAVGFGVSAILCVLVAMLLGFGVLGMRGHYFSICTLGLAIAAGEIAGGIDFIGAGSGMVTPVFPAGLGEKGLFFLCCILCIGSFGALYPCLVI